jgi:hypothetical protein
MTTTHTGKNDNKKSCRQDANKETNMTISYKIFFFSEAQKIYREQGISCQMILAYTVTQIAGDERTPRAIHPEQAAARTLPPAAFSLVHSCPFIVSEQN